MSVIGSPVDTSLIQAAQAQQSASKSTHRERTTTSERAQRMKDMVDLRVAGTEAVDAVKTIPDNSSEQANDEHHRQHHAASKDTPKKDQPRIDITA